MGESSRICTVLVAEGVRASNRGRYRLVVIFRRDESRLKRVVWFLRQDVMGFIGTRWRAARYWSAWYLVHPDRFVISVTDQF